MTKCTSGLTVPDGQQICSFALAVQAVRQAGVRDGALLLDEIDKLTRDARGDPAAALLEVCITSVRCPATTAIRPNKSPRFDEIWFV